MAKKRNSSFPLSNDLGHDFDREHDILNFRPRIEFVEPDQLPLSDLSQFTDQEPTTIDNLRAKTEDLINQYNAIKQLSEQAQRKVDERVKNAGGVNVKLDPVRDAHVIAALKRCTEVDDPTVITYETYKHCLKKMSQQQQALPLVSDKDISEAKADPLRVNFGGSNNLQGQNRPELSSPANAIKPIDQQAFQAAGILKIFLLLLPMLQQENQRSILQHLQTTPHGV